MSGASGNDTLTVDVTRLQTAQTYRVDADPTDVDQLILWGTDVGRCGHVDGDDDYDCRRYQREHCGVYRRTVGLDYDSHVGWK